MGAVKHALLEVEDFVSGCLGEGRTLNQTIRDAVEEFKRVDNSYLLDADFIEESTTNLKGRYERVISRCVTR
jgi:hypothetical protein